MIARRLPFTPTLGQAGLIRELTSFILHFREDVGFVLTGYAGTGKTSVVSALVKVLPALNITPVLLAPTGRAAKVLAAYSGRPAYTIHKQIYYADEASAARPDSNFPNSGKGLSLKQNRSRNTLYIVDEASMIGEEDSLFFDFFRYVQSGYRCRVLLVGDSAQLPPVGSPYSPALDVDYLASSFPFQFFSYTLDQVVRQGKGSLVLENATLLREKIAEEENATVRLPLFALQTHEDMRMDLQRIDGAELEDILQKEYSKREREDIVCITRSNKRANLFNDEIRYRIFGHESELVAGDLLMVLKNNYFWLPEGSKAGFIANGDMIEVMKIKHREELYGFHFADIEARLVDYPDEPVLEVKVLTEALHVEAASLPYAQIREMGEKILEDYPELTTQAKRMEFLKKNPYFNALQIKYAYALTCHKTQGGQWPCVFIDQGYFTEDMLDAEFLRWLYTALTRTVEKAYLLNFADDFFTEY